MTDNSSGRLTWDLDEVSRALKISPTDVRAYFTDGRRVSFILERRLAKEVLRGSLAKSEGAGYDVMDSQGGLWEVRSLTRGGVFFCPRALPETRIMLKAVVDIEYGVRSQRLPGRA